MSKNLKVCILGMGYIGLPTAAILANKGYNVHGVDTNQSIIENIKSGKPHFVEPNLKELVNSSVKNSRLKVSLNPAISDVFIIAVPTPFHKDRFNEKTNTPVPNIDYVLNALTSILPFLKKGDLILLESTSPVGTTEMLAQIIKREKSFSDNIFIAYSPERVLPGNIIKELISNDRIVGGINLNSTKKASQFYNCFVDGKVFETDSRTAEMTKLAENSFRDVNIAFANELSILCDDLNVNVRELISLANRHPRVNILDPGCGVGGHCISVDPWFIIDKAQGKAQIIEQARRTNDNKSKWVLKKIISSVTKYKNKYKSNPTIACMGLAFKPDVDDLRESPAFFIFKELATKYNVKAVEPNIKFIENLDLIDLEKALKMDICIYLVAHKEFKGVKIKHNDLNFCGVI